MSYRLSQREMRSELGWVDAENKALCHAWMKMSQDPILGENQRGGDFGKRVAGEWRKILLGMEKDSVTQLHRRLKRDDPVVMRHWRLVAKETLKFVMKYRLA